MVYALLTSLAVLAAGVGLVVCLVGFVSAMRAFHLSAVQLASTNGLPEELRAKRSAAKRRLVLSMLWFVAALACAAGVTLLRDLLLVGR